MDIEDIDKFVTIDGKLSGVIEQYKLMKRSYVRLSLLCPALL